MARSGTSLGRVHQDISRRGDLSGDEPGQHAGDFRAVEPGAPDSGFPIVAAIYGSDVEARVVELLRNIWGSGRDWDVHDDTGQRRFGLKQPNAEELHEDFAAVLGEFPTQWVYAIRNPADVYNSTLRMENWADFEPEAFQARYEKSLRIAHKLYASGDLFVFDVDRTGRDPVARKQQAANLFGFLGLEPTNRTEEFLDEWPTVNASGGANRGSLPEEEIARRVAKFSESDEYGRLWGMAHNLRAVVLGPVPD